jgi:hypothetical protein
LRATPPRALDQHAPHCFRSGRKEMSAALPVHRFADIDEADIHFVYKGCGLKSLPRLRLSHLLSRQLAQFVIDQRHQMLGSARVALLNGGQDARHFAHRPLQMETRAGIRTQRDAGSGSSTGRAGFSQ